MTNRVTMRTEPHFENTCITNTDQITVSFQCNAGNNRIGLHEYKDGGRNIQLRLEI